MKYNLVLLLFLVTSLSCFAQKKYFFDYIIQYRFQREQSSQVEIRYLLTNSQDNTYDCIVYEEDKLNFTMNFRDVNGTHSVSVIDKNDFFKAETISVLCETLHYMDIKEKYDPFKFDYDFKKDTLINDQFYKNYTVKFHKKAEARKRNNSISYYTIENNTTFHLPMLIFSASWDWRETSKSVPNGIIKESHRLSYSKKKYLLAYKLMQFAKINKYIEFPEGCEVPSRIIFK